MTYTILAIGICIGCAGTFIYQKLAGTAKKDIENFLTSANSVETVVKNELISELHSK